MPPVSSLKAGSLSHFPPTQLLFLHILGIMTKKNTKSPALFLLFSLLICLSGCKKETTTIGVGAMCWVWQGEAQSLEVSIGKDKSTYVLPNGNIQVMDTVYFEIKEGQTMTAKINCNDCGDHDYVLWMDVWDNEEELIYRDFSPASGKPRAYFEYTFIP